MSTVPRSYAKAGGRSSAATREITSKPSGGFKDPFAMFKKDVKVAEAPKTERTVTDSGAVQVQFVKKPKRVIRSAKSDAANAPKFNVVDHKHVVIPANLASLPSHSHGFAKDSE